MPGVRSEAAIRRSYTCPSTRRESSSPSDTWSGATICWATNPVAARPNQATSSFQAADPTPPATAAGTRPIITLVATMNTTGSAPRTEIHHEECGKQPPSRRRQERHDPQVAARDLGQPVHHG